MNLQDRFPALEIRQFYRHSPVKTSWSGQCRVQGFRTVGCCQDDHTIISLKSIHLSKQLVQSLLPFIISTHLTITFFTDSIDLINEYNTRSLFLCLLKQVTYLGSSHAYKHFHKFRAGHGEKRHIRFSGHSLCQHSLTCTRRAYKQNSFWHCCTYLGIFLRIVKVIYDLSQVFFCLILTCYIAEMDSFC